MKTQTLLQMPQTAIVFSRKIRDQVKRVSQLWMQCLYLLLLSPLVGCVHNLPIAPDSVPLSIDLQKTPGKTGVLEWTLHNNSDKYLAYRKWCAPGERELLNSDSIEVKNKNGKMIPFADVIVEPALPFSAEWYAVIAPWGSATTRVSLSKTYKVPSRTEVSVRSYTDLFFGFYASEQAAKDAIQWAGGSNYGHLQYRKTIITPWISVK